MSKLEKCGATRGLHIKAVIICDTLGFAIGVNAALQRVAQHNGANVMWTITFWPVNALNERSLAEKALAENLDARLIVFSDWHAHHFPLGLRSWLERWATRRESEVAALGVIRDDCADGHVEIHTELTEFVRRHSLDFINDESLAQNDAPVTFLLEPDGLPSLPQTCFADTSVRESFRGLGINE
jgi:hypothetical protein